jgi:hypothetical protein
LRDDRPAVQQPPEGPQPVRYGATQSATEVDLVCGIKECCAESTLDLNYQDALNRFGTGITSLHEINGLPVPIKESIYSALIPPDLFTAYGVDPIRLLDRDGNKAFTFEFPPDCGRVNMQFRRSVRESDPVVVIQLSDTRYGQINFQWVIINDPDAERFQIHRFDATQFLPPSSEFRNIPEEIRAMRAGLAPGQVRKGLHKFRQIMDLLESFLSPLGTHLIHGEPYAYHNAIELERIGYFYTSGREIMMEIDREFHPCGKLLARMDGSTPFRQPGMEKTVLGRSWAIHDGILDRPWFCPVMVKMIGRKTKDYTFPDAMGTPPGAPEIRHG